ncbi:DUF58 domain-containing protein (plasmid) [Salipiger sp. H15]|uniref:DUF58 domain-containing protein n=1 Tax=Alloyangia sp. H15 TaxID=3029062 RepID=A0AAU8ARE0_9RHOB
MTGRSVPGAEVTLERLIALREEAGAGMVVGESRSETGHRSGRRQGRGGDIFDLRPFQHGDDPRHIDAAASARSGRAQLRRRHEELEQTVLLLADFRHPMLWGTRGRLRSVAAAEELARVGWRAVAAGSRVGLLVLRDGGAEALVPRPREQAMLDVAGALVQGHAAALETPGQGSEPLSAAILRATAMARPGASVVLATGMDLPGADFAIAAAALMQKCRLEVLLIRDALHRDPPRGIFSVRIGERILGARFAPWRAPDLLEELAIRTRVVDAAEGAAA